jgi:predicted permease
VGRNVLVVAQVALSMVLLIVAGMLQSGFRQTLSVDPGFRTDHLMTLMLDTSFTRYTPIQSHNFYRDLIDRARALPGVRSATLSDAVPLSRGLRVRAIPEGHQFPEGQQTASVVAGIVDQTYFTTMQTEIISGRAFTADDNEKSSRVAIVNQLFAATYWPNQNPLGKRVRLNGDEGPWLEVVGLTRNEKYLYFTEPPTAFIYLPFAQNERPQMSLIVETADADPSSLGARLRDLVRTLDVNQPVFSLRTFASFYKLRATASLLLVMKVTAFMGFLGMTLALVGLYGLVAYSVAQRTREIGIRMAVGAERAQVLRMILRQGMMLSVSGILVGGVASLAVVRLLTAALAGLGAPTLTAYVVVPLLLISLTLAASYIPARRAAQVDPLRALRYE